MAQMESHTEQAEKSLLSNLIPPEFAVMGKQRLEELAAMQTEIF